MNMTPSSPQHLTELLTARAECLGEQIAYRFLDRGERVDATLSYRQLHLRSRRIAAQLAIRGCIGQRVILGMPSSLAYVEALFACFAAGAIPVLGHDLDARSGREQARMRAILASADAKAILIRGQPSDQATTTVREATTTVGEATSLQIWSLDALEPADESVLDEIDRAPNATAFSMYSSGSTGRPKGVEVTHANAWHNLAGFPGFASRPCHGVVSWLPFFHDLGLFLGILHPLFRAAPATLMTPRAFAERPMRWLEAISRWRASFTGGPNFAYDLCARRSTAAQRDSLDLSCLTMALNGAETVRAQTLDRFVEAFAASGFEREAWYPSYGLSDGTATVSGADRRVAPTVLELDAEALVQGIAREGHGRRCVGCGVSLAGQRVVAVDPESREPLPEGRVGELWVSGPCVPPRYWKLQDETTRSLRAVLADGSGPFLRTGDLGFLRDGELFFTGRLEDLIVIRGDNHYPEDIEQTVVSVHPQLRAGGCAAFAVEVEGQERLVVAVEVTGELDGPALVRQIQAAVAAAHGLATHEVALCTPNALPRTSSGKAQRSETRQRLLDGSLARRSFATQTQTQTQTQLPTAHVERIRQLLAAELGVPEEQLDTWAPLSSVGLNSLAAVSFAARLSAAFGRELSPILLYEHSSIGALANYLEAGPAPRGRPTLAPVTQVEPLAIVGMACRFAGAPDLDGFWQVLRDGRETVGDMPGDRWDLGRFHHPKRGMRGKHYTRRGGFLDGLEDFDAAFFGISPREAEHLDPQHRLMLELTWEALEDAALDPEALAGGSTGVFVAAIYGDAYGSELFDHPELVEAQTGTGCANFAIPNRISYLLDLHGPSIFVDTACSGSLTALHLAAQSLWREESELALVGGVSVILKPDGHVFFSRTGALAPDGRCKTFDAAADGMVRSEGAAMIAIKPLSRALADGDPIRAVIRSVAINHDGRSNGLMAPNGRAQAAVLRQAYALAGCSPQQLQYIEAHGTGTPLGDPIEVNALAEVIGADAPGCALGSAKTNLGHLEGAAGLAGVIKVALCMEHGELVPSLHFETPNPQIAFDQLPLFVQRELGPWPRPHEPLLAGVSSFGMGGANAHVVMQAAPIPARAARVTRDAADPSDERPSLLVLSAKTPRALRELAAAWASELEAPTLAASLTDLCWTASQRAVLEHRVAVVGTREAIARTLRQTASEAPEGATIHSAGRRDRAPRVAMVFSGQGTHWAKMAHDLWSEPTAREVLERCEPIVHELAGWSLREALARETLDDPLRAQLGIFTVQMALAAVWRAWGIEPVAVIGHSLGEVAAACTVGALDLATGLRIVDLRARLMQRVAGQGLTAAVGLSFDAAKLITMGREAHVCVAGSNAPEASILAGEPEAIRQIIAALQQQGTFAKALPGVDVAFHSPQMDPLAAELVTTLGELTTRTEALPLYLAVEGGRGHGLQLQAAHWGRNLRQPFQFARAFAALVDEQSIDAVVEISPHATMRPSLNAMATEGSAILASMVRGEPARPRLLDALAQLHLRGARPRWRAVFGPGAQRQHGLPTYPWQRQRHWLDMFFGGALATGPNQRRSSSHPLLGERQDLATAPGTHLFETELGPDEPHYLRDHQVMGRTILPGAAMLEMGLAAARRSLGADRVGGLAEVRFVRALTLPDDQACRVQLVIEDEGEGGRFVLSSRPAASRDASWTVHATGRVVRPTAADQADQADPEWEPLAPERGEAMDVETLRERMASTGLRYGPSFQALVDIRREGARAVGRLEASARLDLRPYLAHPALLDSAFQLVAACASEAGGPVLPTGVGRFRVHAPLPGVLRCEVSLSPASADTADGELLAQLRLVDPSEAKLVAEVVDLQLSPVATPSERAPWSPRPEDWCYALRWQPADNPAPAPSQAQARAWLVLDDGSSFAEQLAAALEARGDLCARAFVDHSLTGESALQLSEDGRRARLHPRDAGSYVRLLDEVPHHFGLPLAGVIHCWSSLATLDEVDAAIAVCCHSALLLTRAMTTAQTPSRLYLITRAAQAVCDGDATELQPQRAALWGFGRAVSREHPEIWGGLIDLEASLHEQDAARVVLGLEIDEAEHREDQVAWRAGSRFVLRMVLCPPAPGRAPARFGPGTYLITGGGGSLGLGLAAWMVEHGARHLVLLGRSALPPRSRWSEATAQAELVETLERLEARGARVRYLAVDVADVEGLRATLDGLDDAGWPPVRGVMHLAASLADGLLSRMSLDDFDRPLRAKLHGALSLCQVLPLAELEFVVWFSSFAALSPMGQANYAAANAFLDAHAHRLRAQGVAASSLGWGPWAGGLAQGLGERFASQGVGTIPEDAGWSLLGQHLAEPQPEVHRVVIPIDWERFARTYRSGQLPPVFAQLRPPEGDDDGPEQAPPTGHRLAHIPEDERLAYLVASLTGICARILKATPEDLDVEAPLVFSGLDSVMAVEVQQRIQGEYGVSPDFAQLLVASVNQIGAQLLDALEATQAEPQA